MEDDVRAAYSKFFDIPFDASEYIDLYTPQVLFEFKYDKNLSRSHEKARVLAQALYYVRRLRYGGTCSAELTKPHGLTIRFSIPQIAVVK